MISMIQNEYATVSPEETNEDDCSCNKKQCLLGISSIAIGVGGLVIAMLL